MIEKLGTFAEPLAMIGKAALTMIGKAALTIVIFVVLANVFAYVFIYAKERIRLSLKKYRDRHKFEKRPTAKCYCIGCHLWYADNKERTIGRCGAADGLSCFPEEFCSRGFPRDDDGYKNEEWRLKDK